jgi:crotonobetainyl-CoA:carnitine CoA-transferase CaiB-like acyl-CoA transferase
MSLDFHRPEAQAILKKLVAKTDIFVENYRPGTFDRWGIGYRQFKEINPRLIYCWLGGFGGWGPGRVRASYDILGQAQGGNFGMTGKPEFMGGSPAKHTIWLADYWGGMMGAVQVLAALLYRNKTGQGTFTEYSQVHGVTRQLEYALPLYGKTGVVRERWGNWDTQLCVHGVIKCGKSSYPNSDNPQEQEEGFIMVSAYQDKDFARLCQAIGPAAAGIASKYAKKADRVKAESQMEIYPVLEKWAADKTKEQVAAALDGANVLNQPVFNAKEVANHPHFVERGAVRWIDDPTYGQILHQGPAYKLSGTPPRLKWALKPVGADNEYVLGKLVGLKPEEIKRLEEQETI